MALVAGAAGCGGDGDAGTAPAPTAPGAATAPAPTRPPPGFPNRGERFLLARLDPGIAPLCSRARAALRSDEAVAGLTCDTAAEHGAAARYELFRSRRALAAAYGAIRTANGVPVAGGGCVPPGGGGRVPGDAPWGFGRGRDEGRVQCYRRAGAIRFVTSLDRIRALAILTAPRFGAVDRFWRTTALPDPRPRS